MISVCVTLSLGLALAGCSSATPVSDPDEDRVSVIVGLYPFAWLATSVGGDTVTVDNLTAAGVEPHDLELSAAQVAAVAQADLVVSVPTLQPALDAAIEAAPARRSFDVTTVVPLELHGRDAEDEDRTGPDPHIWLDPARMATLAAALADELAAIDPAHADAYQANAATVSARLTALDEAFAAGLKDCERTEFIVAHAAFGYLADRYGLTQIGISGLSPDDEPSPARIAAVQQAAQRYGVTVIFFETLASPKVAQTIADDLGLATGVLDPLEGFADETPGADYVTAMEANLAALREANGCRA